MTNSILDQDRNILEGNFVLSLYRNPVEFYPDYPVDPVKDLTTEQGRFFYNLGKDLLKTNNEAFNQVSINSYLANKPELQKQYVGYGGWKQISDFLDVSEGSNIDKYYDELMKVNLLRDLDEKGYNVRANEEILSNFNTTDEVLDWFERRIRNNWF